MTETSSQPVVQPSILGQLRAMRDNPNGEGQPEPAKPSIPEPVKPAEAAPAGEKPETVKGPVETQPEPETDDHTPLPPAAQKRLDKEIARAVSARKAAEAELEKVRSANTTDRQGTEPVKPAPEAKTDARPQYPQEPIFGEKADETWDQFEGRRTQHRKDLAKYQDDLLDWSAKSTRTQIEQEFTERQAREAHQSVIRQAVKDHGEDFLALTETVAAKAPVPLQHAILELEDWPTLAVYLARNSDRLDEVVAKYAKSPAAAIATLGRMQASLKGRAPKQEASETTSSLPAPLKPVGGGAAATASADLNKLSETPGALQNELKRRFPERTVGRR